jgi:hypothetical protein
MAKNESQIYKFGDSFIFSPSLLLATENLQNSILFRICIFPLFWQNRASGFVSNNNLK